jgi:cytochrome b
MDAAHPGEIKVWDLFVRIFHWTVAGGFFIAYFTDDLTTVHVWVGYVIGALVVLRIGWGFVGPKHARFTDFLFSPFKILSYTADLLRLRRGDHYIGHSPAGSGMVFALLLGLLVITGSGLMLHAIEHNAGPLAGFVSAGPADTGGSVVGGERGGAYGEAGEYEDEQHEGRSGEFEGREGGEEFWEEVHEVAANLVLILALVHIGGVTLASFVHSENLVRGMITGRKRDPEV